MEKARLVASHITRTKPRTAVLDLGAAEGYVGEELALMTGARVMLVDVVDMNRSELPHVVYDGRRLPFDADRFDVVTLIYVLHHAASPETVLREARRVSSDRVIVLESLAGGRLHMRVFSALDSLVNRLRSVGWGRGDVDPTLRRFEDWLKTFRDEGLRVETARDLGGVVHRRALFVLSKGEG